MTIEDRVLANQWRQQADDSERLAAKRRTEGRNDLWREVLERAQLLRELAAQLEAAAGRPGQVF